jgi:hypothetical protein
MVVRVNERGQPYIADDGDWKSQRRTWAVPTGTREELLQKAQQCTDWMQLAAEEKYEGMAALDRDNPDGWASSSVVCWYGLSGWWAAEFEAKMLLAAIEMLDEYEELGIEHGRDEDISRPRTVTFDPARSVDETVAALARLCGDTPNEVKGD